MPIFKHGVHRAPREQKALPSQPSLPPSSVSQWLPEHLPQRSGASPTEPDNVLPGELAPQHICGPFLLAQATVMKAPPCWVHCPFPAEKTTAPKLLVVRLPNFQAPGEELHKAQPGRRTQRFPLLWGPTDRQARPPDTQDRTERRGAQQGFKSQPRTQFHLQMPRGACLWEAFLYSKWLGSGTDTADKTGAFGDKIKSKSCRNAFGTGLLSRQSLGIRSLTASCDLGNPGGPTSK